MQLPIGKEDKFEGVVDLIRQKALYFDGAKGENVREEEIPEAMKAEVAEARQNTLEALAMFSDEMMELLLGEEDVPLDLIYKTIRTATHAQELTPVFMGSAFKNKGVQPLLDAIVRFLPSPLDREVKAKQWDNPTEAFPLEPDAKKPLVGYGVQDRGRSVRSAHVHAYLSRHDGQGRNVRESTYHEEGTLQPHRAHARRQARGNRFGRAGDIVAVMGVDCASGDTFAADQKYCSLENMFVPEPVIKMSVAPASRDGGDKLTKALQRFMKEDPTFRVSSDEETSETLIAGMGELHLDIYVERIRASTR
jgi:elongation factor G